MIFQKPIKLVNKYTQEIPDSYLPDKGKELYWLGLDNEDNYEKNPTAKKYGMFKYKLNSKGYRCPEFDFKNKYDIKIVSLGCSWAFGYGLPQEMIYSEILCEKIKKHTKSSVVNYNLSVPCAGNQFITRIASVVSKILKPDFIFVNFSFIKRKEYLDENGKYWFYFSKAQKNNNEDSLKKLLYISNDYDDLLKYYMCIDHVSCICGSKNIKYFWSCVDDLSQNDCGSWDKKNFVGVFKKYDLARDNLHPGKASHKKMADFYWEKLVNIL